MANLTNNQFAKKLTQEIFYEKKLYFHRHIHPARWSLAGNRHASNARIAGNDGEKLIGIKHNLEGEQKLSGLKKVV